MSAGGGSARDPQRNGRRVARAELYLRANYILSATRCTPHTVGGTYSA